MKKLLKIAVWSIGIVVGLLLIAVIGLKLFFPAEKVKAMAIEEGSAALGRPISVESLDISIWGGLGLELSGVKISNPEGYASDALLVADKVDLKLQIMPLISGIISVDRLIIDRPIIVLQKNADGSTNYDFAATESTSMPAEVAELPVEGQAAALAISFDELEINDGIIKFQDDSAGVHYALHGVDLATSLEHPEERLYHSAGRLRCDSVAVTAGEVYPTVALDLNYRITYDMQADALTIERASTEINDFRLKLTGQLDGLSDQIVANFNVQTDETLIENLLSLLPAAQRAKLADYQIAGMFAIDATVGYDATSEPAAVKYAGTAVLTDLSMSSSSIDGELTFRRCLIDFKPDNMRMNIEDGRYDGQPFKGHLVIDDFENPEVSAEFAGNIDLALFEPFLPAEAGHEISGRTSFDLKLSGPISEPERLSFSGNLNVSDGRYNSELVPEPINKFNLDAYFDNRLIRVRELDCQFPSGGVNISGQLTDLVPYLMADSATARQIKVGMEAAVVGAVDLAIAGPYLPPEGKPQLSGELAFDITLTGQLTDMGSLKARGTASIANAAYSDTLLPEPIEHFVAELKLRPDTIEVSRMDVKFTTSDVSFTGQLIRPFPYFLPILDLDRANLPKPLFIFELTSNRFDVDRLFPAAVPGSATETATVATDSLSAIILPDIDGRGTVRADTVIYSQIMLTNVSARIKVHNRKIELYDAKALVYSGSVTGKTTIDLSDFANPHYTGEFNAAQIEADNFIAQFSEFGGHLFGKGNMVGSYDASGWEPEAFLNSLRMDSDLNVRDGKIVTSGAIQSTLSQLADQIGASFDKEQTIRNFQSKITVENGRVRTDEIISTLGDIGDFKLNGSYGFDQTVDYIGTIILSEARSKKLGLKGSKRLEIPFKLAGNYNSVKPEIDFSVIAKQMGENLIKDAAKDLFKGLFKKKK